jgi:hypothetical protein
MLSVISLLEPARDSVLGFSDPLVACFVSEGFSPLTLGLVDFRVTLFPLRGKLLIQSFPLNPVSLYQRGSNLLHRRRQAIETLRDAKGVH